VPGRRLGLPGTLPDQPFRGRDVGGFVPGGEHVPGRPGPDRRPVAEQLAQLGHVLLQRVGDGRRCRVAPHRPDQPVGADHLAAAQRQYREDRPPAQSRYRSGRAVAHDLDRPEKPDLHRAPQQPVSSPRQSRFRHPDQTAPRTA